MNLSKRLAKWIVLGIVVLAFLSCQAEANVLIYVNDLIDLIGSKQGSTPTKATVNVQITSEDDKDKMVGILQGYFGNINKVKTFSRDMNTYLSFDTTFPMKYLAPGPGEPIPDDMIGLFISPLDAGGYTILMDVNKAKLSELNDFIKSEYYQSISISDLSFILTVNNDSRADYKIRTTAVYLNGVPKPGQEVTTLGRRDQVEIRLSDVLRDMLNDSDSISVLDIQA